MVMDLKLKTLFNKYNVKYFENKLENVTVSWSDKMTLCTGKTYLLSKAKDRNCRIRLSNPLLSQRPFEDTLNTLLHEMIHAFLYITKAIGPKESHGKDFKSLMNKINNEEGSKIKVRHSFHNEVNKFRTNVYKCNGPCRHRRPCFGILRRAIARPPGPEDHWWQRHVNECGGTFVKVTNEEITPPKKTGYYKEKKGLASKPFRLREIKRTKFLTNVNSPSGTHSLVTASVNFNYETKLVKFGAEFKKYLNQFKLSSENIGSSLTCDNLEYALPKNEQDSISLKEKFPINKYIMRLNSHTSTESPYSCSSKAHDCSGSNFLKEKFAIDKYIRKLEEYRSSASKTSPEKLNNTAIEFSKGSHSPSEISYFNDCPQTSIKCFSKNKQSFTDTPIQKALNSKSKTNYDKDKGDKSFPTIVCPGCNSVINKAEFKFHMQFCI